MAPSYEAGRTYTLPARHGLAVPLGASQRIKISNTHGTQVVDFWAIAPFAPSAIYPAPAAGSSSFEYTSNSHTRPAQLTLCPTPGSTLLSNVRAPMLRMVEDSSPGVHDTLIAACDPGRYAQLSCAPGTHRSCAENFCEALAAQGVAWAVPDVPAPLNLWMNIPCSAHSLSTADAGGHEGQVGAGVGRLAWEAPVSAKGDYVVFEALRDCIVVMSACPQDIVKINCCEPKECEFVVR